MHPTLPGGFLIAIEGIDGAGKSTLAHALAQQLGHGCATVQTSKEPTRGPWGMRLRQSAADGRLTPQLEADYLIRDRREHVAEFIAPALARGECVVLDRYYPSMVAYQGAAGLDTADLMTANDFAPRSDVLLVLDLPPVMGLARIRARGDVPNAFETEATLEACRGIFLAMDVPNKHVLDARKRADDLLDDALLIIVMAVAAKAQQSMPPVEAVEAIGALLPDLMGA